MILVNTPTAHFTVTAQVYITGTGGGQIGGWKSVSSIGNSYGRVYELAKYSDYLAEISAKL